MPTATSPGANAPTRGEKAALLAILGTIVAVCYAQVATSFFVANDFDILNIVRTASTVREATGIAAGWFQPLTAITYWWTYLAFGLEPAAFHTFDLVCHTVNAWLVALLAWQIFPHRLGAAFAGVCFAMFPPAAECVTWIAGRFDVLCVTGSLLCLTGWIDYRRIGSTGALARTLTGFVIGLSAKDTGMILPAFLVFLWFVPVGSLRPRRSFRAMGPGCAVLLVLFGLYFAVRFSVLGSFGGYKGESGSAHLQIDLPNALRFVADATQSVLAPGTHLVQSLVTLALVVSMWFGNIDRLKLANRVWPLLVCFLIGLAPAANSVSLIMQTGEGSRFLYLPAVFICAAFGVVFGTGIAARASRGLVPVGVILLASYAFTLAQTNRHWREAGDLSREILTQLDDMLEDQSFEYLFIRDLPDHHHGAFVFRNGFENALVMFVSTPIVFPEHGRISQADWDRYAAKRRAEPDFYPDVLLLRWMPDKHRFVTP